MKAPRQGLALTTALLGTILACSEGGRGEVAPTQWVEWSGEELGFSLQYPSDWTLHEDEELISVTNPDQTAAISLGWHQLAPGQAIQGLADELVAVTAAELTDPVLVPIRQDGVDTIEVALTGVDTSGIRWIHHFVVSSGRTRALVVQTIAREDASGSAKPIFEFILTSLETAGDH